MTLNVVEDSFPAFMEWLEESGIETDLAERLDETGMAGLILMPEVLELAGRLAERHTRREFLDRALAMDMLSLPVHDFPDLAESEQLRATGQFFEVWDEPLGRALGFSRSPVDVFERPTAISRAPTLGEHNAQVFSELGAEGRGGGEEASRPLPRLKGIRVVDFCWILAGPLGTKVLADFGAEVIKIETDAHPRMRRVGARPDGTPGPNVEPLFNGANTGKLSVSLDLRTERGRKLVRALVAKSDVVTNNFRPGAMDRMGLGYESLREINPRIVFLNVPRMRPHGAVVEGADAGEHDHGGVRHKLDHRLPRTASFGDGCGLSRLHDAVPDGDDHPGGAAGEGPHRGGAGAEPVAAFLDDSSGGVGVDEIQGERQGAGTQAETATRTTARTASIRRGATTSGARSRCGMTQSGRRSARRWAGASLRQTRYSARSRPERRTRTRSTGWSPSGRGAWTSGRPPSCWGALGSRRRRWRTCRRRCWSTRTCGITTSTSSSRATRTWTS